jgi:hypothetical protein
MSTAQSSVVRVQRIDGILEPVDIAPLKYIDLRTYTVTGRSPWVKLECHALRLYFHPEMTFEVDTTIIFYEKEPPVIGNEKGAPGVLIRHPHAGETETVRTARQIIDVAWLERNGYERVSDVREFAKRLERKRAGYAELIQYGIKKGLISERPLQIPGEKTWWVQWCDRIGHPASKTKAARPI